MNRTLERPLPKAFVVIVLASLLAVAQLAARQAAPPVRALQLCDKWAKVDVQGGAYFVQNNRWGSDSTQCIDVNTATGAWSVVQSGLYNGTSGPPASYPSSVKGCHSEDLDPTDSTTQKCTPGWTHYRVSEITAVSASWTIAPGSGTWNAALDIWYGTSPGSYNDLEIMIWFNKQGSIQPIGGPVGTATLDGTSWTVWSGGTCGGTPQVCWDVVSYVRSSVYNGGTINIKPFQDDALNVRQKVSASSYLTGIDAGFEIWQGGVGLSTSSFSASVTGSGGGVPIATRTSIPVPPTATSGWSPTATRTRTRTATVGTNPTATRTRTPTTGTSPSATPTSAAGGCGPATAITAPFSRDGAGAFCWQIATIPSHINSWNVSSLKVNGVDFTNKYAGAGSLPPKINGYWYISYSSSVSWSHFEAK